MPDPAFFTNVGPFSIQHICDLTNAASNQDVDASALVNDIAALDQACAHDLTFLDNPKYVNQLEKSRAKVCFIAPKFAKKVPEEAIALVHPQPYRAFTQAVQCFYPGSLKPAAVLGGDAGKNGSLVHPSAQIGTGVTIEPGAAIGEGAHIGSDGVICSGAVIGRNVKIGNDCYIGPNASVCYALIGDHVIINAGAQIGQDGFGYAMGADFHMRIPQLGRVIIQDNVDIGANTAIDRGSVRDTVIGEGTKIDNLVQVAHNVEIGRHCLIAGSTAIAGSAILGNFVVIGGQAAIVGHLTINDGAQIGMGAVVRGDVPAGVRWVGDPAKPQIQWLREVLTLEKLTGRKKRVVS